VHGNFLPEIRERVSDDDGVAIHVAIVHLYVHEDGDMISSSVAFPVRLTTLIRFLLSMQQKSVSIGNAISLYSLTCAK